MATDRDSEDSLERLRTVVRANPRSTTFVALAHALCDAGRDDEAEEVCRQGLGQHPRLVTGQVALGRALLQRGRLREAQDVLVDAAKSSPEHGDAFRWLGELSLRKGDPDHARPILEYAEELMPSDAQVADLLVRAGGKPLPRVSRPKTDFEHTRVGNARKLAERMHEDPPTPPTTVSRVDPGDLDDTTPAVTLRGDGTIEPAATEAGATSGPATRLWQRLRALPRWQRLALGALPVVAAVALLATLLPGKDAPSPSAPVATAPPKAPEPPPVDFKASIAAGTLDGLQDVRAKGKRLLATQSLDPDGAAALALVNALLASEHGQGTVADAEEAAVAALAGKPVLARTAVAESARARAALAAGRLAQAKEAVARARTAAPDLAEARFAAGRVNAHLGAVEQASADLEAAIKAAPRLTAARLDLAALRIDAGDPRAAIAELEPLVAADKELLRARLLLAEARRAALVPAAEEDRAGLREACREGRRESGVLRAACAFDRAAAARLEGDRAEALKSARASVATRGRHVNVRAIAQGVLMMATLGDVDNAGEAMRKIREETEPAFVPRAWADMAAALARADKLTATDLLDRPNGPEARFLVARAAFARGGSKALGEALAKLGPEAVAFDPDLKVFATLVDEGKLSDETRKQLQDKAEKGGSSLASYVLGRHALAMGNKKKAAERLAKALQGHGDSCEAAHLLLKIDRKQRPSAVNTEAKVVRLVRGRNGGCSYFARSK